MTLTPQKALNKAYRRQSVNKEDLEVFKSQLLILLDSVNDEHEEHHKNDFIRFLDDTFYKGKYYINTKERIDCVINSGASKSDPVNVIIEHKSPSNKSEMISVQDINKKALQESILYYLRERYDSDGKDSNTNLKQILITNNVDVFIFDAVIIESLFAKNKRFKKDFIEFESDQKSGQDTKFFYESIAKPFIESVKEKIEYTYVNLEDYRKYLNTNSNDSKLLNLFKLFSPTHLLKLNFANDSNSLDKNFYNELLHIIGLEEVKDGGKKLIQRCKSPNYGSILENAIDQVKTEVRLSDVANLSSFGEDRDEQIYNISLELVITWINRILFLKLLESQLISYNSSDDYKFVDKKNIHDYDSLYLLFFKVLAIKTKDRRPDIAEKYKQVPYLNSSLFEITELERQAIGINTLSNSLKLPLATSTVLKDNKGKRLTGEKETLSYLLEFLDAYNFSSEGTAQVQEDNKTLINASVLGLIYEKLNGYKDGSFFTPGYITMYMSHETIRRAVVQKFNDSIGDVTFDSFDDLKAYTRRYFKSNDISKFNTIVNSIRICDPAVGSGHFLVSALNELIAIKHELGILADKEYKPLPIDLEIENDELMITDRFDELFAYNPKSKDSQNIQETLFHEKQTLIENCLFGVDINPNSVKICRLRLWIELLKNTYYKDGGELEVLPNIDINIKCGNSLISRFDIDTPISKALKKSKLKVQDYRDAVYGYKNAKNKQQKEKLENLIAEIKTNFQSKVESNDKRLLRLNKLKSELESLETQDTMFERSKAEEKAHKKEIKTKKAEIVKLENELEEIKSNKIYENAFEWRFEFPEVLADNGDFIGFDVVIGNPPYLRPRGLDKISIEIYKQYYVYENQFDLYHLFIERCYFISKNGNFSLIVPNTFLANENNKKLRLFILNNLKISKVLDSRTKVFADADVDVLILMLGDNEQQYYELLEKEITYKHRFDSQSFHNNHNYNFTVTLSTNSQDIFNKIITNSNASEIYLDICSGIKEYQTGKGVPKQTKADKEKRIFNSNKKISKTYRKELRGKNINRYSIDWKGEYINYGEWLAEPRDKIYFEGERLLIRKIPGSRNLILTITELDYVIDQSIYIGKPKSKATNLKFILGVLNSKLIYWYFSNLYNEFDDLFPQIKTKEFKSLPVYSNPNSNDLSQMNSLVNQILEAKKQDPEADTQQLEDEIDHLVYKLYDLTYDEVLIVDPETNITREEYDA
ncbi:MAG: Eco57I restriction-modification methylase domain-containing protein [Chlorobiota bacterium]